MDRSELSSFFINNSNNKKCISVSFKITIIRIALISLTIFTAIGSAVLKLTTDPFKKFSKNTIILIRILLISKAAILPLLSFLMILFKEIAKKNYLKRKKLHFPSSSEIFAKILSFLCSFALLAGLILNLIFSIKIIFSPLEKFNKIHRNILKISNKILLIFIVINILSLLLFCFFIALLSYKTISLKGDEKRIDSLKAEFNLEIDMLENAQKKLFPQTHSNSLEFKN